MAQHLSPYEEKIEARLQRLSHAVEQFVAGLPAALLAEQSPTRELLEELVVKQSALQWIVRVARHSQGAVRRRLWSDIDDSLAGLEKTLEILPRLQVVDYHDHHDWDDRERAYYTQWENDSHRDHRDFQKRSSDEQNQYWQWRHTHEDKEKNYGNH